MRRLLTRDAFKAGVFARDHSACVVCGAPGVDAHHVIERKLFTAPEEAGGYFLDNGVTLCADHHLAAESTALCVEDLLRAAGIAQRVTPAHLDSGDRLDKWGNTILASGQRLRGELFFDDGAQVALRDVLDRFTHWVKFPRTYHAPWSPGSTSDDKVISSLDGFAGKRVIATIKRDGENTSFYADHYHARSLDSLHHPSRDWAKAFWGGIRYNIPQYWRVCVENLYARHSIDYTRLRSYVEGFHVWDDRNVCLDWDTTLEWFALLGIEPVEPIYDGPFDLALIRQLHERIDTRVEEGFVLRTAEEITYADYRTKAMKWVRPGHVTTDEHWMHGQVIRNQLRTDDEQ